MARKYQFKKYEKTHHQMSLQATKALPTANVLNGELRKDTRTKVVMIIIIIITVQKNPFARWRNKGATFKSPKRHAARCRWKRLWLPPPTANVLNSEFLFRKDLQEHHTEEAQMKVA
jgi:hypothetical protein